VHPWTFIGSMLALAIERIVYAGVWQRPDVFVRICNRLLPKHDPVDIVAHGSGDAVIVAAATLLVGGQLLNLSVFAGWSA
jgi:hypothetical protein